MAEHADNGPSNIGRAARSAPSRRRNPTPSTDTEVVNLSAEAPAAEPGSSALTLDLFDAGAEPGGEHEAAEAADAAQAASAKSGRVTTARRAIRTPVTAEPIAVEPTEEPANAAGEPGNLAAAGAHGDAPQALAATEGDGSEPARTEDATACTHASGTAAAASETLELLDVAAAAEPMEQSGATAAPATHAPQLETPHTPAPAAPSPESVTAPGGLHGAAKEPALSGLPPPNGFSYAATSATGNAARMISVVHAADVDAAVHGQVPDRAASHDAGRAVAALPTEIVAAMAAQTHRAKWMLTAAVAALVVTAGVAIAQTLLLASLSADTEAQQQRFDVLMQNQQAALDSMVTRLAAPAAAVAAVAPPPAGVATATGPTHTQPAATSPRRAARAAKAPKTAEKAASHSASSKAHSQHATSSRQAAAKN